MYDHLVNIISLHHRLRDLAATCEFDTTAHLELSDLFHTVDQGIDRFTQSLQSDCTYTWKREYLILQLDALHLGLLLEEKILQEE